MRHLLLFLLAGCVTPIGLEEHRAVQDADRDGVSGKADCDDTNADVRPGVVEWCNGIDDDCDGVIDGPTARGVAPFWPDGDGDGFGLMLSEAVWACEAPPAHAAMDGDCNDGNPGVFPDAGPEVCDGEDNDCNGLADTEDPGLTDGIALFQDSDGDTYGDPSTLVVGCASDPTLATNGDDCDDTNAAVNPGAVEVCNTVDDDCDTVIDPSTSADAQTWWADLDGDGYGDPASTPFDACDGGTTTANNETDCDDGDGSVNPGATEICNGVDDDCVLGPDDGLALTAYYGDVDGDGYGGTAFTVDACIAPPGWLVDSSDCDDGDPLKNPGATERCNGADDDCVGGPGADELDGDGDGVAQCAGDCDDADPAVLPGALETCNGVDDDCAGGIDDVAPENLPRWYLDGDLDGYGDPDTWLDACQPTTGYLADDGDCDDGDSAVSPDAIEVCGDGIDNDCNRVGCGPSGALVADDGDATILGSYAGIVASVGPSAAGDLDGDGGADLVLAADDYADPDARGALWVLSGPLAAGSGDLDAARTAVLGTDVDPLPASIGVAVATADFSGDGLDDLVTWGLAESVLFDGVLAAGQLPESDSSAVVSGVGESLATGHFDLDGFADLAAVGGGVVQIHSGPFPAWSDASAARTTLSASDAMVPDYLPSSPGDVSGDGVEDLLIGNPGRDAAGAGSVFLVLGPVPDGPLDLTTAALSFDGNPSDGLTVTGAAGDLTGDGVNDVVVMSAGSIHVVPATGFGLSGGLVADRAVARIDFGTLAWTADPVALLDLNGDGIDDLVTARSDGAGTGEVRVFYGPLEGVRDASTADAVIAAPTPRSLLGADLNHDGIDDLVLAGDLLGDPSAPSPGAAIFFGEGF